MKQNLISAGKFKATCLQIMDEVDENHVSFIITKHGKPVAQLIPIEDKKVPTFGCLKGTITIQGDIIEPIQAPWDANNE